jgi:hypothetical protein
MGGSRGTSYVHSQKRRSPLLISVINLSESTVPLASTGTARTLPFFLKKRYCSDAVLGISKPNTFQTIYRTVFEQSIVMT